jgi:hypothetical protein
MALEARGKLKARPGRFKHVVHVLRATLCGDARSSRFFSSACEFYRNKKPGKPRNLFYFASSSAVALMGKLIILRMTERIIDEQIGA